MKVPTRTAGCKIEYRQPHVLYDGRTYVSAHDTMTQPKKILIIAGPNGAGKTTFTREFLIDEAQVPTFINADLIAVGLNPLDPERVAVRAGRLMLRMIHDMVDRGGSFAFETTLSGRGFARMIPEWRE